MPRLGRPRMMSPRVCLLRHFDVALVTAVHRAARRTLCLVRVRLVCGPATSPPLSPPGWCARMCACAVSRAGM